MKRKVKFIALSIFLVIMSVLINFRSVDAYAKDGDGDLVIIIDPGHGGYDGGAVSVLGDTEATLNWNIAKAMKAELETYAGVKVYVTRGSNEWNTNTGRSQLAQKLGADAIISIHNNSSGTASTSGFVAYGSVMEGYVEVTKNLCLNLARYASAAGLDIYNNGYLTRGATLNPSEDFYTVINEGIKLGIPTIIVEHCFLSNSANAGFINDTYNQKKVGVADARAVAEFYGLSKRTINDGGNISLERSYSAYFVPNNIKDGITFASSDTNVAHVRSDGLITAVNPGTATISYTNQDGSSGSCTITTKEVRQVGVSAGINPTVYRDSASVAAIDKSKVIVKAIYSDGTVRQVTSGYTIGNIDPNIQGRQYISVSHNGFSNTFSITLDTQMEAGTYSEYLYQTKGEYQDIFALPEIIELSMEGDPYTNPGFTTVITPGQSSTEVVAPQETTAPETTVEETTVEETTTVQETTVEETTTVQETTVEETTTNQETTVEETSTQTEAQTEKSPVESTTNANKTDKETQGETKTNSSIEIPSDSEEDEAAESNGNVLNKIFGEGATFIIILLVLVIILLVAIAVLTVVKMQNEKNSKKKR